RGDPHAPVAIVAAHIDGAVRDVVHRHLPGAEGEGDGRRGRRAGDRSASRELSATRRAAGERAERLERHAVDGYRGVRRPTVERDPASRGDALAAGGQNDAVGGDGRVDAEDGRLRETPDRAVGRRELDVLQGRGRALAGALDRRTCTLRAAV